MRDKLDYFPFISGEMLEKHRVGLSGEMRADFQNYLIAKSQTEMNSTAHSRKNTFGRYGGGKNSSAVKPMIEGMVDIRSDRLVRNTP